MAPARASAESAIKLAPTTSYHRVALARVLRAEKRYNDARGQAQAARQLSRTDEDRKRADEYLAFLDEDEKQAAVTAAKELTTLIECRANDGGACDALMPRLAEACDRNHWGSCAALGELHLRRQDAEAQALGKKL